MRTFVIAVMFLLSVSCTRNILETPSSSIENTPLTLTSLITKSSISQVDSLKLEQHLQKDEDNLMVNRIVYKDSVYVLTISRKSACNVGVSEETYNKYLEYVENLNSLL